MEWNRPFPTAAQLHRGQLHFRGCNKAFANQLAAPTPPSSSSQHAPRMAWCTYTHTLTHSHTKSARAILNHIQIEYKVLNVHMQSLCRPGAHTSEQLCRYLYLSLLGISFLVYLHVCILSLSLSLCLYTHMYIYIYIYLYKLYTYIYI
jgi:hypothetical protein